MPTELATTTSCFHLDEERVTAIEVVDQDVYFSCPARSLGCQEAARQQSREHEVFPSGADE